MIGVARPLHHIRGGGPGSPQKSAAEAFRQRYGLVPAGPEGMRRGAELFHRRAVTLHSQGGLFRISVQNLYEKVCGRFDVGGVEILTPADPGKEFLLGDVPAITIASTKGEFGESLVCPRGSQSTRLT